MLSAASDGVLLIAHGTVSDLSRLPQFLSEIRRGRPASPELLAEMRRRYALIGGSPLLDITAKQAHALAVALGIPAFVGMRFGDEKIEEALLAAARRGIRRLCLLPVAPFSSSLYCADARQRYERLVDAGEISKMVLSDVPDWGAHPGLVEAQRDVVSSFTENAALSCPIVATAHSLPAKVVESGDPYADEVRRCVTALNHALGRSLLLAYQSQADAPGEWLGPSLLSILDQLATNGEKQALVVPVGFLSEHVETLYDLDYEARSHAERLGMALQRVPALNDHPRLIACLKEIVLSTLLCSERGLDNRYEESYS